MRRHGPGRRGVGGGPVNKVALEEKIPSTHVQKQRVKIPSRHVQKQTVGGGEPPQRLKITIITITITIITISSSSSSDIPRAAGRGGGLGRVRQHGGGALVIVPGEAAAEVPAEVVELGGHAVLLVQHLPGLAARQSGQAGAARSHPGPTPGRGRPAADTSRFAGRAGGVGGVAPVTVFLSVFVGENGVVVVVVVGFFCAKALFGLLVGQEDGIVVAVDTVVDFPMRFFSDVTALE